MYILHRSMKRSMPQLTCVYENNLLGSCFQEKSSLAMGFLRLKDSDYLYINVNFQCIHPNSAVPTNGCSGDQCWFLDQMVKKQKPPVDAVALGWDFWCISPSPYTGLVLLRKKEQCFSLWMLMATAFILLLFCGNKDLHLRVPAPSIVKNKNISKCYM